MELNGQIEQVCEQVYSAMKSQAMESAMDTMDNMDTLPMPGCFRMRSHSYVRAIDQGCAGEDEEEGGRPLLILPSSPPRTPTTVRTIQSSTGVDVCIKLVINHTSLLLTWHFFVCNVFHDVTELIIIIQHTQHMCRLLSFPAGVHCFTLLPPTVLIFNW